ncbi:uncharacterized protein B0H64DRAFT_389051 [Chaetomium fimeti]|uniref:Uncharacterized protein n=1 Tax=Chaetomium fimeti TaxID=1854472 RepID=A0AAE0LW36_9PEZI|nr:hypothetical protein B0H64DRAFT_389051 [Chaetomium fimeti]
MLANTAARSGDTTELPTFSPPRVFTRRGVRLSNTLLPVYKYPLSVLQQQQHLAALRRPTETKQTVTQYQTIPTTTITMKAVTTILLSLATLAFAAPNPHADADALAARQEDCTYVCQCQGRDGTPFISVNRGCCDDNDISEDGKNCNKSGYNSALGYAACCELVFGSPVCEASESEAGCPPVL